MGLYGPKGVSELYARGCKDDASKARQTPWFRALDAGLRGRVVTETPKANGRVRAVLLAALICAALPVQGNAQTTDATWQDDQSKAYILTINMLDADGYRITAIDRTFLNRIMVRATKGQIRREIVISEATGMVLRDVIFGE